MSKSRKRFKDKELSEIGHTRILGIGLEIQSWSEQNEAEGWSGIFIQIAKIVACKGAYVG